MGKNSREKLLKDLGLADGFYDQADLGGCEGAAIIGVAVGSETFVESGETVYPLTQLAPGGIRGDVGTVELGQLRTAVFS